MSTAKLVFADEKGEIFDHPELELMGKRGDQYDPIPQEDLIELPEGTKLFTLPGRLPVGWDSFARESVVLDEVLIGKKKVRPIAVSAFMPPGYARSFMPAAVASEKKPFLPLWAYGAVGWKDGKFYAAGIRVDHSDHWDPEHYDDHDLIPKVKQKLADFPANRLLQHLQNCALNYHCLAAKNLFYRRWECPLPVSPVCNADCVGCISLQPEGKVVASHERLKFLPSADEMTEIAIPHLESAAEAVVSFGQGCEGEPLLQAALIEEVIRKIRAKTPRGIIHINSNASKPDAVEKLSAAGLNSLRISLNSVQPQYYERYYRPKGYTFNEVRESVRIAGKNGLFTSVNYLTFPGFTDRKNEYEELCRFLDYTGLRMMQWKNLNIDPDQYQELIGPQTDVLIGIRVMLEKVRARFPKLIIGYFNRPQESIDEYRKYLAIE